MILTEYKGYKIVYSDNGDEWSCSEADIRSPSLLKIKRRIDNLTRAARSEASVGALDLSYDKGTEVKVVEFLGDSRHYKSRCAVLGLRHTSDSKVTRWEVTLGDLCAKTHSNMTALKDAEALRAEAAKLNKKANEIVRAIPRLTKDDIAELIKLAETVEE